MTNTNSNSRTVYTFEKFAVMEGRENGRLFCLCPEFMASTVMCQHVKRVYREELDGHSPLNPSVKVVIFTDPQVVVDLRVGATDDMGDRELRLTIGADPDRTEFLGYVRDGEGRLVLRSIVLDYLTGLFLSGTTCPSPHHYHPMLVSHQEAAVMADPTVPANIARTWSILRHDACPDCCDLAVPDITPPAPPTSRRYYSKRHSI